MTSMDLNLDAQDVSEGGCQQIMCGGLQNKLARMTLDAFESWMMSLNVHFKSQMQKVLLRKERQKGHHGLLS